MNLVLLFIFSHFYVAESTIFKSQTIFYHTFHTRKHVNDRVVDELLLLNVGDALKRGTREKAGNKFGTQSNFASVQLLELGRAIVLRSSSLSPRAAPISAGGNPNPLSAAPALALTPSRSQVSKWHWPESSKF